MRARVWRPVGARGVAESPCGTVRVHRMGYERNGRWAGGAYTTLASESTRQVSRMICSLSWKIFGRPVSAGCMFTACAARQSINTRTHAHAHARTHTHTHTHAHAHTLTVCLARPPARSLRPLGGRNPLTACGCVHGRGHTARRSARRPPPRCRRPTTTTTTTTTRPTRQRSVAPPCVLLSPFGLSLGGWNACRTLQS